MARLFGFIGNRAELGSRILSAHSDLLRVRSSDDQPLGWGVGFYQFGEVLLRRRPLEDQAQVELAKVTDSIKTDVLIGHVRRPTVGNLRTENTHPFRYRQWLFAQTGTLEGFAGLRERLLEVQPAFLKPNVRGDTDSELFFYLFLSCLHDNGQLNDQSVNVTAIHEAMRAALALVDRLCESESLPKHRGDILVTNGEHLVAVHRSGKMASRLVEKAADVEELLSPDSHEEGRVEHLAQVRCCVVASELQELPEGWQRTANNAFLSLSRTEGPEHCEI